MSIESDHLIATNAVADDAAWNEFIQRHGNAILTVTIAQCESNCRLPRCHYDCILRAMGAGKPQPADSIDSCKEGLALYEHLCALLRPALKKLGQGQPIEAFLDETSQQIHQDYLSKFEGRLTLPGALEALSPFEKSVFRLACRKSSRGEIARRLETTLDAVKEAEKKIATELERHGLHWWGLEPALTAPIAIDAPAWVHRGVIAEGDAPEPVRQGDTLLRKVFLYPQWWVGIMVGAAVSVFSLLVVLPSQEYANTVREPSDELIYRSDRSLEPELDAKLKAGRVALTKGRIDTALLNLNAVIAKRGDDQEARWLLATTYERLGDRLKAAKHYRLFLEVDDRLRAPEDDRIHRARAKLQSWNEMP